MVCMVQARTSTVLLFNAMKLSSGESITVVRFCVPVDLPKMAAASAWHYRSEMVSNPMKRNGTEVRRLN